jgi:hypothetical protein
MSTRVVLAAFAMMLVEIPMPAVADCPSETLQQDDIIKAIQKAPSCKAAFDVMNACRYNAGGDVALAEVVIEKCEAAFLSRINAQQKRSYQREREACARKYANKSGTMYVSFQVTCEAAAAVKSAQRWGDTGVSPKPRKGE